MPLLMYWQNYQRETRWLRRQLGRRWTAAHVVNVTGGWLCTLSVNNVLGRVKGGVNPSPPVSLQTKLIAGNSNVSGSRHALTARYSEGLSLEVNAESHACASFAPVRFADSYPMPALLSHASTLSRSESTCKAFCVRARVYHHPSLCKQGHESVQIRVVLKQAPVHPANLIILAISIVVAVLRPPDFISHCDHGDPRERILEAKKLFAWRLRNFSMPRSSLGPSLP